MSRTPTPKTDWLVVQYHPRANRKATITRVFAPGSRLPGGKHWSCETEDAANKLRDAIVRGVEVPAPEIELVEFWGDDLD